MNRKEIITIGIPTYYGGPSLVKTIKSILNSKGIEPFKIIITVDGNPLDIKIYKQLSQLKVEVLNNKDRLGQVGRINQLIRKCDTEFIILTQDDVLFEPNTLQEILIGLKSMKKTMVTAKVVPLPAYNMFERMIHVGVHMSQYLAKNWLNGDNYFAASGRCLGFNTQFIRKFKLPEEVIDSDTYLYLVNKLNNGSFYYNPNAIYHIRSPKHISEHFKQSKKYQYVTYEMKYYLNVDLSKDQPLPKYLLFKSFFRELFHNPFYTSGYLLIMLYTRIFGGQMFKEKKRFWDTDTSTKEI